MPQNAIGKYRWTICALLFFATTINYLDRQVLSLLQPTLAEKFGWSNTDYANIAATFQFVYAISMLFAGRFIDRLSASGRPCRSLWIRFIGCAANFFCQHHSKTYPDHFNNTHYNLDDGSFPTGNKCIDYYAG